MKNSEILIEAKKLLWDGTGGRWGDTREDRKEYYICHAIEEAMHQNLNNTRRWFEHSLVTSVISFWMGGNKSIYDYADTLGINLYCVNDIHMQTFRHALMDKMIAHWQEKGQ